MSYVDGLLDKTKDRVYIVERDKDGNRVYRDYPVEYVLYYDDPKGKHQTIYRTPVTKFSTQSNAEFRKEMKIHSNKKLWEQDVNPIFRCLEKNYLGADAPNLHLCFIDIESDLTKRRDTHPLTTRSTRSLL